jgi:putative MATE family efflux protein
LIFVYGYNIASTILRGMGDSKYPFYFISISAVLNLLLDLLFVVELRLGAGGAALATVLSQSVSFFCSLFFLAKNRARFSLGIRVSDFLRWDKTMLLELIRLGFPMAIKSAAIQVSKIFTNSWINSYGIAVSAFSGIANKLNSISNLISNAMNTAGATMIGQNIAAKQFRRVGGILRRMFGITLSTAAVISVLLLLYPEQIFGIFTQDQAVLSISREYLLIAVLTFFGSACRACMNAFINGSGHYRVNFITAVLDGFVMRIGLAVFFGLVLDLKYIGFWVGDALARFTPFVIGMIFLAGGQWKNGRGKA